MQQADPAKTGPPITSGVLRRTRLFTLLDDNREKRLLVVQAQKGQGKSVLVADYLAAREYDHAWYTLDGSDAHLLNLLKGLSHSIARTRHFCFYPPQPSGALALKRSPEGLVREWVERNLDPLEEDFYLVLDDSHRGSPATETLLGTLLSGSRTNIRVVVISRWPLCEDVERFCRDGGCFVLGNEDLKFTWSEAKELLEGISTGRVRESAVREIWERTEGWVAGLLLFSRYAAERNKSGSDRDLLRLLRREGPVMFQQLAREILDTFSADELEFLMAASLFENVSLPLPSEITGPVDAARLLERMRTQNLFTSCGQPEGGTYVFHSLFKSFLRAQARTRLGAARKRSLTLTVASHLKSRRRFPEAVDVLLRDKNFDEAVRVIEKHGLDLWTSAWPGLVRHWKASFPRALAEKSPWLTLLASQAMKSDSPAEASEGFQQALDRFTRRRDHAGRSICLAHLAELSMFLPGAAMPLDQVMETINGLIGTAGLPDYPCRCLLLFTVGLHELYRGPNLERGARAMLAAAAISGKHNDFEQSMLCHFYALMLTLHMGRDSGADGILESADRLRRVDPESKVLSALYRIMQVGVDLFGGRFGRGLEGCRETRDLLKEAGLLMLVPILNSWELLLRLSLGDAAGMRELLEKLAGDESARANVLKRAGHLLFSAMLESFYDRDHLKAVDDVELAVRMLEDEGAGFILWTARFARNVILARSGSPEDSLKGLAGVRRLCRKHSAAQLETSVEAYMALLDLRSGSEASGERLLRRAFGRCEERGRPFLFCMPHDDLASLCREAISRDIAASCAWRLLGTLPAEHAAEVLCGLTRAGNPEVGRQVLRTLSAATNLAAGTAVRILALLCETGTEEVSGEARAMMSDLLSADPPLCFTVLEDFEVRVWGARVDHDRWRSAKALKLLKLLCVHFPHGIAREVAAECLWPDGHPDSIMLNLRVTLSRLRKLLSTLAGDICLPVIKTGKEQIGLNPLLCRVDLCEFRRLCAGAMKSWAGGDRGRFLQLAREATGICPVTRVEKDLDCEWMMQVHDDTARQCHELLWKISLAEESAGNLQGAAQVLEDLVAGDNLREDACRSLMSLYARMGNRSEAIRVYRNCRAALLREIGVEPEEATRGLLRNALGVDPTKV